MSVRRPVSLLEAIPFLFTVSASGYKGLGRISFAGPAGSRYHLPSISPKAGSQVLWGGKPREDVVLRFLTGALLTVVLAGGQAQAEKKPSAAEKKPSAAEKKAVIEALNKQIAALKAEEKVLHEAISARFKALLRVDRLTEAELAVEREALKKQEEMALALTADPAHHKIIRDNYEKLRGHLKGGVKLEEAAIKELKEHERQMHDHVKEMYIIQVKAREAEIRALR